jgi:transcriptional regulator with XRE-family HTH domain
MDTELGTYIRQLRRAQGWTLQELANRSGLPLRRIHSIEVGQSRHPHLETLNALALVLEEDISILILKAYSRKTAPTPPP